MTILKQLVLPALAVVVGIVLCGAWGRFAGIHGYPVWTLMVGAVVCGSLSGVATYWMLKSWLRWFRTTP